MLTDITKSGTLVGRGSVDRNPFSGDPTIVEKSQSLPGIEGTPPGIVEPPGPDLNAEPPLKLPQKEAPRKAEAPVEEGAAGILLEIYKREGAVGDDFEIDPSASAVDFALKYKEYVMSDVGRAVEETIKEKYGEEVLKNAQMLQAGNVPYNEYAMLSFYSNVDVESENEEDVKATKMMIEEMYRRTLKGKSLERFMEQIDETSHDFVEIGKEAREYFQQAKNDFRDDFIRRDNERKAKTTAVLKSAKSVIEAGKIMGMEISKQEAKRYVKDIFEQTDTYTMEGSDGKPEVVRGSKYEKYYEEIRKNPEQLAMLMMLVVDQLNLELPIQAGKKRGGDELDQRLKGALAARDYGRDSRVFPVVPPTVRGEVVGRIKL